MKESFDPQQWLNTDKGQQPAPFVNQPTDLSAEVDTVITRIEAAFTDIAPSYADWVNLGFAFASEFGEAGRDNYHRVSRFYSGYTKTETDKQYDQCLKAQGHGITIRTFFHLAKQAGIEVGVAGSDGNAQASRATIHRGLPTEPPAADPSPEVDLPPFPDEIFEALPGFLQRVVERSSSKEERDILLLGSLTTMSSCLYRVFGIYDDKKVFPNLYLYVTAKASAGKGRLVLCKKLVQPVHWSLREQARNSHLLYEQEMREFNVVKNKDLSAEKPQKPPEKLLFIPANSSSTGMFQLLWDNEGRGLIFETEGDTLAQAFKTDYGNYSDGFRKAYHHETITYYRRTDREYVEILFPRLSTVLSGTPRQVSVLIPNAENGLFSRFLFYYMNMNLRWKNVFERSCDQSLDEHFNVLGKEFYSFFTALNENDELEFRFTPGQQDQFHRYFTQVHEKYLLLQGVDYLATIRRLGLNAFRIAMILSALRLMETGDFHGIVYCRDHDFQIALSMIRVLVRHASHVYSELPEEVHQVRPKNKKEQFLDALPERFIRHGFLELANSLGIAERTADKYIGEFCDKGLIMREQQSFYVKIMDQ
ncbi:MAG TPA: DUF3987 domain-containing protein [Prolixibacteraceae bacterium]|nr:DUF3987 domain-containing protein [Prolixibacteraceae bacterium]